MTTNKDDISYIGQHDPKKLADILYYKKLGKNINWNNPQDLNEKINWLAFNTDTSTWTHLSDKHLVRKYVKLKGLVHILPKLYSVWKNPEDISFENLPGSFVLKCNHDSGSVSLIKNKELCNIVEIKAFYKKHISVPFGIISAEPHYLGIKRLILAEEYLENDSILSDSLIDYKFWSFRGKSDYCHVSYDTTSWQNKKSVIYDVHKWKLTQGKMHSQNRFPAIEIPKPHCLDEMLDVIHCLTKDLPQCRVDLYESNKKLYFGELTFTPGCGRIENYTSDFLIELGSKINLPI